METTISKLIDLSVLYDGLFQIRYYGTGLSSVTFKVEKIGLKVKFSGTNFMHNLEATHEKVIEKLHHKKEPDHEEHGNEC